MSILRLLFFLTKGESKILKQYKKLKGLRVNSKGGMRIDSNRKKN